MLFETMFGNQGKRAQVRAIQRRSIRTCLTPAHHGKKLTYRGTRYCFPCFQARVMHGLEV